MACGAAVLKWKKILVVAAHPDDEVLGCGGTMARLAAEGADVTVLLLGEGPLSREACRDSAYVSSEHKHAFACARKAGCALGISRVLTPLDLSFSGFPDNRFDSVPLIEIVKLIERVGEKCQPDTVLTHHVGDLNIDHRITHQAVVTAFRPLPGSSVKRILAFEVPSSSEYSCQPFMSFMPSCYVNIEGYLEKKMAALQEYASEMRLWPHPRSYEGIEFLARMRGAQTGVGAAESFSILHVLIS